MEDTNKNYTRTIETEYTLYTVNNAGERCERLAHDSVLCGSELRHYLDGTFVRCKLNFPTALFILSTLASASDKQYLLMKCDKDNYNKYYVFCDGVLRECDSTGIIKTDFPTLSDINNNSRDCYIIRNFFESENTHGNC